MADLSSLVIRLSADVATLQSDLGRASAISSSAADRIAGSFNSAFGKAGSIVKEFAVTLAAAFTVDKIVEVGKSVIDLGDNLNKMSQKVGVSVESLSSLRVAAQLSDVGLDDLGSSMGKLARTAAEAAGGSKQQAAAFSAIGVAVKDASGQLRPMQSILQDVAGKFAGYEDSAAKTALAQELFGKSGAQLIPLLNQLGKDGFDAVTQSARDYNQVIGAEQAAQSEQFNDNLTRLGFAATGFANALVKELLPSLVRYSDDMAEAAKTTDGYTQSASGIATVGKSVVLAFTAIADTVRSLVTVILALGDTLGAAGDLFKGFGIAVVKDLTAIGEAMRGNFAAAKVALDGAGASLAEGWATASARVRGAWAGVQGGISDAVKNTGKAYDDLFGQFSNVSAAATTTAGAIAKTPAPIIASAGAAKTAAKAHDDLAKSVREAAQAFEKIQSLTAGYLADIADIKQRMSGADDAQIAYNKALRDIQENYAKILELGPPTAEAVAALGDATKAAAERMDITRVADDQKKALEQVNEELRKSQDQWGDWADAIFDSVTKGGNLLKNLLESVKQIVTQMLKEWFRTQIIGMFAGGGGGYGGLIAAGAGALMGGSSSSSSSGGAVSSGASAAGFDLSSPSTWITAGKNLWKGFTTQSAASQWGASSMFGSYAPSWQAANAGNLNMSAAYGQPGGLSYAPSTFGYLAAGAAGVYAGYNRFQNSNKDVGGAIGGITYGVGTYAATIGAGAAITGGLAAGLAAVPVVGWIALALMAVDYLSGGKLFGTKGKLDHTNVSLGIGADGADLSQSYTLKGQKAFFGGTKWTTKDIAPTAEALQAAKDFYDALVKNRDAFAKEFNAKVGELVGGTYQAEYDKKGNIKSQSTTVLGVTYKDETQEDFANRLTAENMIAVLSQFDSALSETAASYRKNVDSLMQFASAATFAQTAFMNGAKFLALGSDQTITALIKLAEGAQRVGETIDQTVQRLGQAQAQYDQFVAQFKAPMMYVDPFEAAIAGINDNMQAAAAQANALARAAGAEGAATEDLINIHKRAAEAFAAAIAQLKISAATLSQQLGYAPSMNLDDINSQIAALESIAGQSSTAVSGFGDAMNDAAQRARDSINLLLGDLSPYNDQQKLQIALQGQLAGTVTPTQVLEIARRLMGTGADYAAIFAQVSAIGDRTNTGSVQGGGNSDQQGLTANQQKQLDELKARRDMLEAAQRHADAQTLAQQIADIAASTGESIDEVLKELGITDLAPFLKDLDIANREAFDKYIQGLEDQSDSLGNSVGDITEAIDKGTGVLEDILVQLGGHSSHGQPGSDAEQTGHSSHSAGGNPLADPPATAPGRGTGRPIYPPSLVGNR